MKCAADVNDNKPSKQALYTYHICALLHVYSKTRNKQTYMHIYMDITTMGIPQHGALYL